MPTTIDLENAKQIRQPMDVIISMEIPDEGTTLTFSGYTESAKVADGVLSHQDWSMRQLADLQEDGFPLDGSRVLYDPNTSASASNGKIGVRGNIGAPVTITVTGSRSIASLSIFATGASSVTYNGTTSQIAGGQVIIPVGATSITLTFNPAGTTTRIEVSDIIPGTVLNITNDTLIKAVVSLRSDLSLFGQTLPESELNVEVYNDADISEVAASLPEDSPITYRAGYDNDLSPERKFYVAGQVTWADNVLSIHAVDAVHFLDDVEFTAPVESNTEEDFLMCVRYALERAQIHFADDLWMPYVEYNRWIVREGTNARNLIAFLNQCYNFTDDTGAMIDGGGTLDHWHQFSYRDAGIPEAYVHDWSRRPGHEIYEYDCAAVEKFVGQEIGEVGYEWESITNSAASAGDAYAQKVGSATFLKNIGTSLSFDKYAYEWLIGLYLGPYSDNEVSKKLQDKYGTVYGLYRVMPVVPTDANGYYISSSPSFESNEGQPVAERLLKGEVPQTAFNENTNQQIIYSTFIPWSQAYDGWEYDVPGTDKIRTAAKMWKVLSDAKVIQADAESIELDIYGCAFEINKAARVLTKKAGAGKYEYDELPILGAIYAKKTNENLVRIYPDKMLAAPLYRSNITGSFTWKGDPRMQPRDVVEFHRLDGTVEEITLENITITHEGGGTSAEITYRKGIV